MPIRLPTPNTTRETQAGAFIDLVERQLPLVPGMNPAHIVRQCYITYKETGTTPELLRCAGRLIAQYLPIIGLSQQWAFLVLMTCPPTQPMSDNATFMAFTEYSWLFALHQQVTENKPNTLTEFTDFAHAVVDPAIKPGNIPEPPWTPEVVQPFRRGFAALVEHFYAP